MIVSVVILNWNGENLLRRFLPSVVEHSAIEGCEVVVADNGSSDGSLALLRSEFPSVRIIELDLNYGFTGGYNRAIAQLDATYVLLLNSDIEVTEGYLQPLLSTLEGDSSVAAVMPKILSYNSPKEFEYAGAAGGYLDPLGLPYCRGRVLSKLEEDRGQYDDTIEVFWATGAAMLVRRELYETLGGLDEDFFAHMEEIDFCWRAKNSGYKIVCNPTSSIYHLGGGTLNYNSPFKLYLNFRNSLYMLYKNIYGFKLLPTLFLRMCFDGAIAIYYLLVGKYSLFAAISKAHISLYKSLKVLKRKKRAQRHTAKVRMNSPLIFVYLKSLF